MKKHTLPYVTYTSQSVWLISNNLCYSELQRGEKYAENKL